MTSDPSFWNRIFQSAAERNSAKTMQRAKSQYDEAINQKMSKRQKWVFQTLGWLPVIGILTIILCSAFNFSKIQIGNTMQSPPNAAWYFLVSLGYGVLIGGAAYISGCFGGFLFGLPRYLTNPDAPSKSYTRNDNLIQISDWLTKIIVGLGLTNLHKIPALFQTLGDNVRVVFGDSPQGSVIAQGIVIFFLVSGFLYGYLWTNIQYIPILTEMDQLTRNIAREQLEKQEAANAAIDSVSKTVSSNDPGAFAKVEELQTASSSSKILSFDEFRALIKKAEEKLQNGLSKQSNLPADQRDPNKGQWGGKAENQNRRLTANIMAVDGSGLYRINLSVTSTNPQNPLQDGEVVVFALHHSFKDPCKIVTVRNGKASLNFASFGAFTVGALVDNGQTELEFDLSEIPNAPEKFRNS